MPLRIAIAQPTICSDVRANSACIRGLMAQASAQRAALVHFPEGSLSGYVKAQIKTWADVDWPLVWAELAAICTTARELGIWVVVGCNHELEPPLRPRNSLYVISDQGKVVGRYDKRYCSNTERLDWYSAGTDPLVFDVNGYRLGCALCIEIQFMELFAEYERLDVDCLLFSSYSKDPMFWTMAQAYAAANCYWFSVSVPAQCSRKSPSGLIGPDGQPIMRCRADVSPDLVIADIDREAPQFDVALKKARPWRRLVRQNR